MHTPRPTTAKRAPATPKAKRGSSRTPARSSRPVLAKDKTSLKISRVTSTRYYYPRGESFVVVVGPVMVGSGDDKKKLQGRAVAVYSYDEKKRHKCRDLLFAVPFRRVFVGRDTNPEAFGTIGSSVLIQVRDHTFIHVGKYTTMFDTPADETITEFYSTVRSGDMTTPCAVGTKNAYYLYNVDNKFSTITIPSGAAIASDDAVLKSWPFRPLKIMLMSPGNSIVEVKDFLKGGIFNK
jgi:hypothetical protein